MIQLDSKTLRQLQMIELEMLIEVNRICKKCGIHYTIIAGTMLGAVRHGGFIPWDDDADIGMLRSEYEKFRVACESELDTSRFYFQDNRNTKGYRWGYGKLRRKETVFTREFQEHMPYEQGVFIDIFPMDGIPDNYLLRCIHSFHCFCIRKILWSEVGKKADKRWWMRIWFGIMSKIPDDIVFSHYEKFIRKSNRKKTKLVRMLMFPSPTNDFGYLRKWYLRLEPVSFEGYYLVGMKDKEEYLSWTYGDYMQLPPEGKRKVHPVSEIRLIDMDVR